MVQRSRRQSRSRQQSRSQRRTRTQRRSQRTRTQRRSQTQRRSRSQRGGFWGMSTAQPQFIKGQIGGGGGWGSKTNPNPKLNPRGKQPKKKNIESLDTDVMRFFNKYF